MVLPQGFQSVPTIFGEPLAKDLRDFQLMRESYYDTLIARKTKEAVEKKYNPHIKLSGRPEI